MSGAMKHIEIRPETLEAPETFNVEKTLDRPPARTRFWMIAVAFLTIMIMASGAWFLGGQPDWPVSASPQSEMTKLVITVDHQYLSQDLNVLGTISAERMVAVVAPFNGVVLERHVQLGDHVDTGTLLLVLDTGDLEIQQRDAQTALLKAQMKRDSLAQWKSSTEVLQARRTLENATTALAILENQVLETKTLLDKGIVSRNEYDGLVQQRDAKKSDVEGYRLDLNAVLARGGATNMRLATLELKNAKARLEDLQQQVAGAKVLATASGVLTQLPKDLTTGQTPSHIEAGAQLTRGQPLFAIADTTKFVVSGTVDQVDVNLVRAGQPVTITSDAFPDESIAGEILSVSAEASNKESRNNNAVFDVRAVFQASEISRMESIRIGMLARMKIGIYTNANAIIVPIGAIRNARNAPAVTVRDPVTGNVRQVAVQLGVTTPEGVEITDGLVAGDQIQVQ